MNLFFKKILPYGSLFVLTLAIALMCAVPPISRDALTHHLAIPKLYILYGGIYELPDIICSYYPQLLDLIYCIPMIFNNDIIPKYIHFLFALLTALLIYKYIQKRINKFYALLSVLFFLSLPVIIKLSITVYVDLGLIFFSFAALLCLLKWQKNNLHLKWLILSAICCGLALSTKYNGMITLFLLTTFIPFMYLEKATKNTLNQLKAASYGILFLIISVAVFSPWMVKNYIWKQNPVYPLYDNYFNPAEHQPEIKTSSLNHFLIRKYVHNETWLETVLIPVRIFFQGKDDNPKYFDGRLNPLLFFLPIFAFINFKSGYPYKNKKKFEKKILFYFSALFILIAFFQTDMRIRWIGPAIPPLIILAAYGLDNISRFLKKAPVFLNWLISFIIIITACLNFLYLYNEFNLYSPVKYISGKTTRDEYIQKRRPEYAALKFANQNLGNKTKLFAFYLGSRRYYSNHDISFNIGLFKKIIKQSDNENIILKKLKNHYFTDLIINFPKFNEWITRELTKEEKKKLMLFFNNHTGLLFNKDGHGLYHLK
jgi:hypothetical protein